jgi:hypothetical protein
VFDAMTQAVWLASQSDGDGVLRLLNRTVADGMDGYLMTVVVG